jgi:hypothetical protein
LVALREDAIFPCDDFGPVCPRAGFLGACVCLVIVFSD